MALMGFRTIYMGWVDARVVTSTLLAMSKYSRCASTVLLISIFPFSWSAQSDIMSEDITSAVLERLTGSCGSTGCVDAIIDQQTFSCDSKYPTYMTYRARLVATSETDSDALISLIEGWVSEGASIIVNGVLMTVDSECPVAISSLTNRVCEPPQQPTTPTSLGSDRIIAIIGGVVAIILVAGVIIVISALVLKKCREHSSTKNTEKSELPDSPVAGGVAIKTSTNTAYWTKRRRESEEGYELSPTHSGDPHVANLEGPYYVNYKIPSTPPSYDTVPAVPTILPVAGQKKAK